MKQTSITYICNRCGAKSSSPFSEFSIEDQSKSQNDVASGRTEYAHFAFHLCPPCMKHLLKDSVHLYAAAKSGGDERLWVHPPTSEF